MTLLGILAASAATTPPPPASTLPYGLPTTAPWNSPTYAVTPTPDGTGSVVHPDVIDMGAAGWRGWRYWLAITPYYLANASKENPVVLASHDGYTWQHPTGGPVAYLFGTVNGGANSDTDLVYDPGRDELVLIWREYRYTGDFDEYIYAATSSDGVTWSDRTLLWTMNAPGSDRAELTVSPAVVRVSGTDWRAWTRSKNGAVHLRTAPDRLGPWSALTVCTLTGTGGPWHLDVISVDGVYWAVMNYQWNLRPAVSVDGIAWTVGAPFLNVAAGSFDSDLIYRATIQPADEQWVNLWYSSNGASASWRMGYTHVPRTLWTNLL